MIPEEIRLRAESLSHRLSRSTIAPEVAVGELAVVATPDGLRRIVLIADVNDELATASIYLATEDSNLATHLDVLLTPDESRYPVPLIAQAELYGPVFTEWLDARAGQVAPHIVDALRESLLSDGASLLIYDAGPGLAAGSRLTPLDDRKALKVAELADLERITGPCWDFLLSDRLPHGVIDPRLFCPPAEGTPVVSAVAQFGDLLELMESINAGGVSVEASLALLEPAEWEELDRWWTEFGCDLRVLGLDRFNSLALGAYEKGAPQPARLNTLGDVRVERLAEPLARAGVSQVDVFTMDGGEAAIGLIQYDGPRSRSRVVRVKRRDLQAVHS